jgi:CRISPR-associated protein Csy1
LSIRALEPDWTLDEYYQALPLYQKIWLDNARVDERETNETWLNDLTQALVRWLFNGYESCLKQEAISFADGELLHVRSMIENLIQKDKELLI